MAPILDRLEEEKIFALSLIEDNTKLIVGEANK